MKYDRQIKLLFCILFLVLLIVPNAILFSDDRNKLPAFNIDNPIGSVIRFKNSYKNNFFFKPEMVDSYLKFKLDILDDVPLKNTVITGKDGWYFLGNEYNQLLNDGFGSYPFSEFELIKIKNSLKRIIDTLTSKGVAFYIVVPPNKHRVYPEKLPYHIKQKPTRLEVLNSYLKKEIDFEILDLRDTLVANKGKELLYYKTNTHWNDLGAFIAYHKTLNTLQLDLPKEDISNYTFDYKPIQRGDITEMINLKLEENAIFLNKKISSELIPLKTEHHHLHFKNPNRNKKLIMHRDSFSNAWIQFFNESFGETIYFRNYSIRPEVIDKEKPDVVIFEIIERELSTVLLNL
ncbi:alginate O-acetyltransferase AlgX-related protein [Psychroserpens mesophilus]|uniref:alginate O-acetyltransferase AlgX-related protein n=1 Tax=Psychroserpens mesophilus TaxID=325473 RepID=UPI003D646F9C